jgi:predicted nucleic acid-binding Zn ribbon protein
MNQHGLAGMEKKHARYRRNRVIDVLIIVLITMIVALAMEKMFH